MSTTRPTAGDRIRQWLLDHPVETCDIAFDAIAGLYLDTDDATILPEDECYPRGSGSDYVDDVGYTLGRAGILPLITEMQDEADN